MTELLSSSSKLKSPTARAATEEGQAVTRREQEEHHSQMMRLGVSERVVVPIEDLDAAIIKKKWTKQERVQEEGHHGKPTMTRESDLS